VGSAPPPFSGAQGAPPLCYVSFFFFIKLLVYYPVFGFVLFFLFFLVEGQSVQGAMLICPREYRMPVICSSGGLLTG
jgi:hypothetical protein